MYKINVFESDGGRGPWTNIPVLRILKILKLTKGGEWVCYGLVRTDDSTNKNVHSEIKQRGPHFKYLNDSLQNNTMVWQLDDDAIGQLMNANELTSQFFQYPPTHVDSIVPKSNRKCGISQPFGATSFLLRTA